MKYFIWRLAGGDCEILERSGKDSQYSFFVIGIIYLVVISLTFLGFFGLFWGVFRSMKIVNNVILSEENPFFTSLFGGIIMGFLVSNVLLLNLMSLEPKTLPIKAENKSLLLTNILRYTSVLLISFFVSKNIEMGIINVLESAGFFHFNLNEGYIDHMTRINKQQPWLWLVTIVTGIFFLLPVFLRQRLSKSFQYYSLKGKRDIRLIKEKYDEYLIQKNQILNDYYGRYKAVREDKKYVYKKIYEDEPFNTKRLVKENYLGTGDEFIDAFLKDN